MAASPPACEHARGRAGGCVCRFRRYDHYFPRSLQGLKFPLMVSNCPPRRSIKPRAGLINIKGRPHSKQTNQPKTNRRPRGSQGPPAPLRQPAVESARERPETCSAPQGNSSPLPAGSGSRHPRSPPGCPVGPGAPREGRGRGKPPPGRRGRGSPRSPAAPSEVRAPLGLPRGRL